MSSTLFKVGFDIHDYHDILRKVAYFEKEDEVINSDESLKGNIVNCVWVCGKIKTDRRNKHEDVRLLI